MTQIQQTNYYNVVTLSVPIANKQKSGFQSAIASSIYLNTLKINYHEFLERMNLLHLRNINLVFISNNVINYDKVVYKEQLYGNSYSLTLHFINIESFFSYSSFEYYFNLNKNKKKLRMYICLSKIKLLLRKDICNHFASTGVDISGGSNSKKHLISLLQHRLSLFLLCAFGSESYGIVNGSFHKPYQDGDKKTNDYSTKSNQNLIIDFARANEI
jgi:hypothetical protein